MYYFVSDIHLGAGGASEARQTERRFVAWLESAAADADAIYILGDMFDFWFEYKRVVPKGFVRTLAKLAELTERGVKIVFLTGNHDMWVRDYLTTECGVEIHTRPVEVELCGRRMLLAHGDNMNIKGQPALKFMNSVFRSRIIRYLFSWGVHPDLAMKFGQWWSGSSRKSHGKYTADTRCTEPLIEYARRYSAAHAGVDTFVFGHMHVARDYRDGRIRVVSLGEWRTEPTYAVMNAEGEICIKTIER